MVDSVSVTRVVQMSAAASSQNYEARYESNHSQCAEADCKNKAVAIMDVANFMSGMWADNT